MDEGVFGRRVLGLPTWPIAERRLGLMPGWFGDVGLAPGAGTVVADDMSRAGVRGASAQAARHLLGGAPFDLPAMGQLRHQVLAGAPHLGNERAAWIV
jgi:hypothetical protein